MFYVYMLRCKNNILYTGITTDVSRRIREHRGNGSAGAKFTRSHSPEKLEAVWSCEGRSPALRLEARIKKLQKPAKERLIKDNDMALIAPLNPLDYSREEIEQFEAAFT